MYMSDNQLGRASFTIYSWTTRALCLIVKLSVNFVKLKQSDITQKLIDYGS